MRRSITYFAIASLLVTFVMPDVSVFGQTSTVGVYITVKYKKKCENHVMSLDGKKSCLAPQPVVTVDDISHITPISLDFSNQPYFSLVFKESGVTKLKNLSKAFPNTEMVLVADNLIMGYLKDLDMLKTTSLKMTGDINSGKNVDFVHEKMKAVLPLRK